jgi:hypothetical protein
MKLLEIYVTESNVQRALLAAVKLTVYHERWYHEIVVSFAFYYIFHLITSFFYIYSIQAKLPVTLIY